MKPFIYILTLGFFSGAVAAGLTAIHNFATLRAEFELPLVACVGFVVLFSAAANLLRRVLDQERRLALRIKRHRTITEMLADFRGKRN